jgi:hypothetical protein
MPEQAKIIQRRLLVLNQHVLENAEHRWSANVGISGRHEPESVVGMDRNRWSAWPGLRSHGFLVILSSSDNRSS